MPCKDKESQAASARKHYLRNKAAMVRRAAAFKIIAVRRNQKFVRRVKKGRVCTRCGYANWVILQFHHIRRESKLKEISMAIFQGWSIKRLKEEIRKCVLLCPNCHAEQTMEEIRSVAQLV